MIWRDRATALFGQTWKASLSYLSGISVRTLQRWEKDGYCHETVEQWLEETVRRVPQDKLSSYGAVLTEAMFMEDRPPTLDARRSWARDVVRLVHSDIEQGRLP